MEKDNCKDLPIHQLNIVIGQYWRDWEISVYFEMTFTDTRGWLDSVLHLINSSMDASVAPASKHLLWLKNNKTAFDFVSISMNYLCKMTHIMTDRGSQLHNWRFLLSSRINQWEPVRVQVTSVIFQTENVFFLETHILGYLKPSLRFEEQASE